MPSFHRFQPAAAATPPLGLAAPANHFNFLRLLLACLVIVAHSPILVDGDTHREPLVRLFGTLHFGFVAVSGFFLLSGFLVAQSWQRQPRLLPFLVNRCLRIFPGFIVAFLVSVLFVGALGSASPWAYLGQLRATTLLSEMLLLRAPSTPNTFMGSNLPVVNGNFWTVSYEFNCYLFLAVMGAGGLLRRPRAFLGLTLAIAAIWLLPTTGSRLVPFCAAHFGVGYAKNVYMILLGCQENGMLMRLLVLFCTGSCFALFRDRLRFSFWLGLASLILLVPCLFSMTLAMVALTTLGAYAFFTFAFLRIPLLAPFQGLRADVSYGVYLYNWPAQKLLLWYWPGMSPWTLFFLTVPASAAAGWLSWQLVEHPCLRLKRRRAAAPTPPDAGPPILVACS